MTEEQGPEQGQDRTSKYNAEYYEKNKDKLGEKKGKRYREDPDYQRKMKLSARKQYWLGRRLSRERKTSIPEVPISELSPAGYVEVTVDNPVDTRNGQTLQVPVYSSSEVAKMVGRTVETFRIWLKEGVVPEPHFRGRTHPGQYRIKGNDPRLFTQDEVRIIEACREHLLLLTKGAKHGVFTTCVAEAFGQLVQGVQPLTE